MWQRGEDGESALSSEPRREWVTHEGVLQLGFVRATSSHQERRVADVRDFAAVWRHAIHYAAELGADASKTIRPPDAASPSAAGTSIVSRDLRQSIIANLQSGP